MHPGFQCVWRIPEIYRRILLRSLEDCEDCSDSSRAVTQQLIDVICNLVDLLFTDC